MAVGTTTIDFGAFPGSAYTSVAVIGQTAIVSGSLVEAWIRPVATADHTVDEHMVDPPKTVAANIVEGVGFTIHSRIDGAHFVNPRLTRNNNAPMHHGLYTVAWAWT